MMDNKKDLSRVAVDMALPVVDAIKTSNIQWIFPAKDLADAISTTPSFFVNRHELEYVEVMFGGQTKKNFFMKESIEWANLGTVLATDVSSGLGMDFIVKLDVLEKPIVLVNAKPQKIEKGFRTKIVIRQPSSWELYLCDPELKVESICFISNHIDPLDTIFPFISSAIGKVIKIIEGELDFLLVIDVNGLKIECFEKKPGKIKLGDYVRIGTTFVCGGLFIE